MYVSQTSFVRAIYVCALITAPFITGCNNNNNTPSKPLVEHTVKVNTPDFNADVAYEDVAKQVSFGPRVPGTPAQKQCAAWMEEELKKVCDTVYKQNVVVRSGDGKDLPCINLIGVINPKATKRILLLTHWDSRPCSCIIRGSEKNKRVQIISQSGY
jgi:glutaminyl-peptide cyclotransferase